MLVVTILVSFVSLFISGPHSSLHTCGRNGAQWLLSEPRISQLHHSGILRPGETHEPSPTSWTKTASCHLKAVYVKDTSLCERYQSMWKIPVYVKDTSLCERCQSMWKMPVYVKDASLCERYQSMWKMPVYVKDTSLCERCQSWDHDWKIMSRSSKNIELILQWAKDKLFFKTG